MILPKNDLYHKSNGAPQRLHKKWETPHLIAVSMLIFFYGLLFLLNIADPHYPFAELFMCLGFFLIYGIEVTVHTVLSGSHGGGGGHGHRSDFE